MGHKTVQLDTKTSNKVDILRKRFGNEETGYLASYSYAIDRAVQHYLDDVAEDEK